MTAPHRGFQVKHAAALYLEKGLKPEKLYPYFLLGKSAAGKDS
jgi:hypothetical protein